MSSSKNPMAQLPEDIRLEHLMAVSTVARVDGQVNDAELNQVRSLCKTLELSDKSTGKVIASMYDPESVQLQTILQNLSHEERRFTLLTDAYFLALSDNDLDQREEQALNNMAKSLRIDQNQMSAIEKYVESALKAAQNGSSRQDLQDMGAEVAANLGAVGIPVAAVAVSGSVFGLSAAGITSGLAALGMGLGMVPGIGTAIGMGIFSYLAIKWIYKTIFKGEG